MINIDQYFIQNVCVHRFSYIIFETSHKSLADTDKKTGFDSHEI
jgi:hypothetical protein